MYEDSLFVVPMFREACLVNRHDLECNPVAQETSGGAQRSKQPCFIYESSYKREGL